MAIPQGGTPTHYYEIPFSASKLKDVEITYAQNDEVKVVKTIEDCTIRENEIITELTQEETFLFDKNYPVQIQLRLLDDNDKVHPSEIMTKSVKKCLSKEVLE